MSACVKPYQNIHTINSTSSMIIITPINLASYLCITACIDKPINYPRVNFYTNQISQSFSVSLSKSLG